MLLAVDIGGTKTLMALYSKGASPKEPMYATEYQSLQHGCFEDILKHFLSSVSSQVQTACIAVAGPIQDQSVQVTNLPWKLESKTLQRRFNLEKVKLLNDVEAMGYALPVLEPSQLLTLQVGQTRTHENMAIVAPGTGLGQAFLIWKHSSHKVQASEGGHVDFAPTSERQVHLLRFAQTQLKHVSVEQVCSGSGMLLLYDFLCHTHNAQSMFDTTKKRISLDQATRAIVEAGYRTPHPCPLCKETLDLFAQILAAHTANFALLVKAKGGVYLAGGLLPHLVATLKETSFAEAFCNKGRFSRWLSDIPIHLANAPKLALWGAACCGQYLKAERKTF